MAENGIQLQPTDQFKWRIGTTHLKTTLRHCSFFPDFPFEDDVSVVRMAAWQSKGDVLLWGIERTAMAEVQAFTSGHADRWQLPAITSLQMGRISQTRTATCECCLSGMASQRVNQPPEPPLPH